MLIATSGDGMRQACEVVVREPVGFSRAFQLQLFCFILESAAAGMALAGLGLLVFNLAGLSELFV